VFLIQLKASCQQQVVVKYAMRRKKRRKKKLKITDNQTDNKTKQENMIKHFR